MAGGAAPGGREPPAHGDDTPKSGGHRNKRCNGRGGKCRTKSGRK